GVVNRARRGAGKRLREIAVAHLRRRHGRQHGLRLPDVEAHVVREEKRPALRDRPAERAAELVLVELAFLLLEEVAGVERVVAKEFEAGAVQRVRPALGRYEDGSAAAAAGFRRVAVRQDLEFLNRLDR